MAFAIKITANNETMYYSQTIVTIGGDRFSDLILLTNGKDPEEVDVSRTLIQAEEKLETVQQHISGRLVAKIVEFPEVIDNDSNQG